MKNLTALFFTGALAAMTAPACLHAADAGKGAKVTYPSFDDSKYIHGPKIKASDLKGKVVFFEYWGINCPPCIASMPHLQELQDKYQSKGFTVVGSHRQGLSPGVKKFLEEKNISFPVYQGLDIPAASCPGGLPHAVLIGANGKVVAKGYPPELYDLVKKEVLKMERGIPILEDVELNKYKSLAKTVVSNGSNIESKITPLRKKTDDEEAQAVCAAFDDWLGDAKDTVQAQINSNPLEAVTAITRLKAAVPSVKEFDETLATLKANKDLPKLADLNKKISALEQRKAKGRKVTKSDVKPLMQAVDQFAESDNEATQTAAANLKNSLSVLAPESPAGK